MKNINYIEINTINEKMKLSTMILGAHHFGRNVSTFEEAERLLDCFFKNGGTDCWGQIELIHVPEDWELEAYKTLGVNVFAFTYKGFGYFYKNYNKPIHEVEDCPENIERLKHVKILSKMNGMAPQQIVLGFFMGQEFTVIPIATSTSTEHLLETMNAADTVLTKDEVLYLMGRRELAL